MNLPNRLTIFRILLTPVMVACLLIDFEHNVIVAGLVFALAALTDYFDGKIARERSLVTNFGKFADPLADKILVISALLCFVQNGWCSVVLVIVVLFREFSVTSVRLVNAGSGRVIAANMWGKTKTVSQMISILLVFALQYAIQLMQYKIIIVTTDVYLTLSNVFLTVGNCALWISAIAAVISGIVYLKENWDVMDY
jgi:CDP-diacylglycerol--glycerol-3-phosphate 3-phosphatidyltransferase